LASWVFKEKLFKEDLQNGLEYNGNGSAKTHKDRINTGSMNIPKGIVRKFSFENKREDSPSEIELVEVGDIWSFPLIPRYVNMHHTR